MSKRLIAAVCCLFLSGCASIVIDQPTGSQTPASPPVQVPFSIEITKSVYGRSASVNGVAINLSGFTSTIKPGTSNTEVLTGTVPFQPGSYTLTVSGTYNQWTGQASPISATSNFTVTAKPTVSLSVTPSSGILVPRNGASAPLNFAIARTNSTAEVDITAPDLPTGVTLPAVAIPSISTSDVANLSAGPIANGQANVHFTAKMAGADDAVQVVSVRVVPVAGTITWVAAPFLGPAGAAMPTSPDGRFKVTASRSGAQRVWNLHIVATSSPAAGVPPKFIDVAAAQWGGAGGSNLAGIAFCPSTTLTTLSALVISDIDENADVTFHPASVTYRLKVIRFDGGTPRLQGTIEGIYFRGMVQPRLGFSPDCSIVGGWTTNSAGSTARTVTFLDIFNGLSTTPSFSFTDTAMLPATSLAAISGANINLTPPSGPVQTKPVP